MRIVDLVLAAAEGAFSNDDQAAIRAGAPRDGFAYEGAPVTPGFRRIRQPATAVSAMLVLEDGAVVTGDGVAVQYAGVGGREPLRRPGELRRLHEQELRGGLVGREVSSFRESAERLAALAAPLSLRYGLTQALLGAAAHSTGRTVAEVVAAEYQTGAPLREIPIFAQSGEDRRLAVDRMVLRCVDELPHGLINNVQLVGDDGERLVDYVAWVRDRVMALRESDAYLPVLHFDCYGTIGQVFPDLERGARYIARHGEVAAPLTLRIEHPVDAGSRDLQIATLARLRAALERHGSDVQLVADEWCNTREDVEAFVASGCVHMAQVKTPDLGSLDEAIRALLACREYGVAAYCGGSCTETERAGQVCAGVAMGVDADLLLARPGMGVDEAVMVVRNEMGRTRALIEARGAGGAR
jgi:methylaspartate ammonia-lyase